MNAHLKASLVKRMEEWLVENEEALYDYDVWLTFKRDTRKVSEIMAVAAGAVIDGVAFQPQAQIDES